MMKDLLNAMSKCEKDDSSQTKPEEPQNGQIPKGEKPKPLRNLTKAMLIFLVCSAGSVLFSVLKDPSPKNGIWVAPYDFKLFKRKDEQRQPPMTDKLLGGLLPQGFDENSCLSRYQEALYHKQPTKHPSSYLISRLRRYEVLHKKCGPYTESYKRTLESLKSAQHNGTLATECNYVVWIALGGIGNRMLTLASVFLYAFLTNRVLLVHPGGYISDLFCEPFPEVSWLLPPDFPIIDKFKTFYQRSPYSYGNILRQNNFRNSTEYSLPAFVYLHLAHDYANRDKLFFCDEEQTPLQKVPWLIIKTNNYFIPSLFLIESFEEELHNLFPDKEAVFHLLGRYLFHPTDVVRELIARFYEAYLSRADEVTGIQIRTFGKYSGLYDYVMDLVLGCLRKEVLLPEIIDKKPIMYRSKQLKTKAVIITSLSSRYSEALRVMYHGHQTATGDIIEVYQPSHEEYQQSGNKMHNIKALAEIYLLSLSDNLVTSAGSTFGYVAQSLGGLKPWILMIPTNQTALGPPCQQAVSMEPCFHAPPAYGCGNKKKVDAGQIVPHVQHCEDRNLGLKLVEKDKNL
ncbi:OLC1v1012484C1 [Oldenlandia corymbosa var. corymbosa]|uniref:Fucosyltransferase n=1 Tax=Oldenlandia corymbosa var. corymbosa TaxID=529605 RepID=A0AAV1DW05_OLDCO|nr:OLC1v1012484C1 [Oldenlandia corymbosa var. corymbosa]